MTAPTAVPVPPLVAEWAPGAVTIIVAPYGHERWMVRALDADDRLIPLDRAQQWAVPNVLRNAYPEEDWTRPVTWRAGRGVCPTAELVAARTRVSGCAVCDRPCRPGQAWCSTQCRNIDDPHDEPCEEDA